MQGRIIIFAIAAYVLFVVDRLVKIGFYNTPEFFRGVVSWLPFEQHVYLNSGVILGWQLPDWLIITLSAALLMVVALSLLHSLLRSNIQEYFGWCVIMMGGLSNVLDRFRFGAVIDWWEMPWGAVINLADVYIIAGIVLVIYSTTKKTSAKS